MAIDFLPLLPSTSSAIFSNLYSRKEKLLKRYLASEITAATKKNENKFPFFLHSMEHILIIC